ncbi:hypothetical protein REJC140_00010 [Pseudorhizobium endolithicum]|uniref:Transcriptional regulator n=1 Tax=Pseudorhizobium endolithicum TaxID=1191678 RepID=A0ABN7JE39_9HYPH|nr:hypothetical protein [Pseudorhizobium endolithicum]CAD7022849.1 hypothetical protein REJC140_00010 [Pseudorhizobium endolithicum]
MIETTRHAAESLFRHPAATGSNAAKLEEFRLRQKTRMHRARMDERQERLEKRNRPAAATALIASVAAAQSHG